MVEKPRFSVSRSSQEDQENIGYIHVTKRTNERALAYILRGSKGRAGGEETPAILPAFPHLYTVWSRDAGGDTSSSFKIASSGIRWQAGLRRDLLVVCPTN